MYNVRINTHSLMHHRPRQKVLRTTGSQATIRAGSSDSAISRLRRRTLPSAGQLDSSLQVVQTVQCTTAKHHSAWLCACNAWVELTAVLCSTQRHLREIIEDVLSTKLRSLCIKLHVVIHQGNLMALADYATLLCVCEPGVCVLLWACFVFVSRATTPDQSNL